MQIVPNPEVSWLSELKGLSQNVPMNKFLHVKKISQITLGTIYWVRDILQLQLLILTTSKVGIIILFLQSEKKAQSHYQLKEGPNV